MGRKTWESIERGDGSRRRLSTEELSYLGQLEFRLEEERKKGSKK